MPAWGNTDSLADKPHFPEERQVRPFISLTTANSTTAFAGKSIQFTGINAQTAANLGIVAGMSAYASGLSTTGEQEFFSSNNIVLAVGNDSSGFSANLVSFSNTFFATIPAGTQVDFAYPIRNNSNVANTYFADTILVSPGRIANTQGTTYGFGSNVANTKLGSINSGWNKITRKILPDGTIRFLKETLVCITNTAASNASSANTSSNAVFGGL
jgi:hypothetical protein